jgi:riboflavin kinase/FMN adenylyltransferase
VKPSVLTIGKFDGVHAGHAELLHDVIALAREHDLSPSVLTFDRHPVCVLAPDKAPRPLTSIGERCERMREIGIEQIFVLPFTKEVARLSPEQFAVQYLRDALQARFVLVGRNFRFGYQQAGNPDVLAELGSRYGFEVRLVDAVTRRGLLVSTSEVRGRLERGEVEMAARLLERPYAISGEVVTGYGIGSKQTVPTLNLQPPIEVLPANGVYITRTHDLTDERVWDSITNIGTRPTFDGQELTVETFLLGPLSGESPSLISVEFLRRVRDERKFEDPAALKRQILHDVGRAQTFFRRLRKWVDQPAGN